MKYSTQAFVLFSLLPVITQALPAAGSARASNKATSSATSDAEVANDATSAAANATDATAATANNATDVSANAVGMNHAPSPQQIANAVLSWMADTGKVTKFLNTAASFSGDEFTREATIALNAEKDELNHKKVLDDAFLAQDPVVQAANDVLDTQGTFQAVVDVLQAMVDNGPDNAQAQVDEINQNRCVNVLPNIDAYFSVAGSATVNAVTPTGCLEIVPPTAAAATNAAAAPDVTAAADANATAAATEAESASTTDAEAAATDAADAEAEAEEEEEDMA